MTVYLEQFFTLIKEPIIRAIFCIVGSFVAAKISDWIITRILSRLVDRTSSSIDDKIVQIFHRPIYYSILFIGLGISVKVFHLPEALSFVILGFFKTICIIIWSVALFQSFMHFINWYSNQEKDGTIIQAHTLPLFDNIGKVAILMLAIYCILISWKIDVTGIVFPTSILAVIIGFAAKDTVANVFAGLFIMTDTPYKPGDYINLDGGERGYVKTIGLRSTRIMTRDDIEITVPNALIANSKIINESGGGKEDERIRINLNVSYNSDIDLVRNVLIDIANSSENVSKNPNPRVRFRSFGDSGIVFELLFWIKKPEDRGRIIDEINSSIFKRFKIENIEIPFPQRTIHMKNSGAVITEK